MMEENKDEEKLEQMVGPAMKMMEAMTVGIVSKNVVAEFVEKEVGGLFEGEGADNDNMAAGFLVKMQMEEANKNPKHVLRKFLRFYNSFREFYMTLEKSAEADANPPEEPDDSTAEDTDKE